MIEGRFNRRETALSVGVSSWEQLPFNGQVEVAGKHDRAELRAKVADEQQHRGAHRSPSGAFIIDMNVGDRGIRASHVGSPAELPRDHHSFTSPCGVLMHTRNLQRCAREDPRKGVLVEEHGAIVLVGYVQVLREETAGHEACPVLDDNDCARVR